MVSYPSGLNMFDLLVMTCVHPSDDLCCIFCNHVSILLGILLFDFFLNVSSILFEGCCELFQVVAYVAASVEELSNSFVKEGFEVYGHRNKGTKIVNLIKSVEHQESVLGKLQKELVDLNAMIIERKNQR